MRINEDHISGCWMNVKDAIDDGICTLEKEAKA